MPTLQEIDREVEYRRQEVAVELARRSLLAFTKYTFEGEYQVNWHHKLVADEIDAWLDAKEPYNLLIEEPPRHGKSEQCSRRLPPYIFGKNPNAQVLFASYSADLASAMSRDAQRVMLSNFYSEIFPNTHLVTKGYSHDETAIRQANEFTIVRHKGSFRASGVGGGLTGRGADIGIIDDPFKNRQEAESETVREGVIEWYKSTFRTRLEKGGRILMLLTRWHLHDLAGWCIDKMNTDPEADKWKVVSLPAIYEEMEFTHPKDPRKEGEALWPNKYSIPALRKIKASIGTYDWNALFQQQPSPPGGAVFKREWARVIDAEDLPPNIYWVRCWDLAVTAKTSADWTASQQIGRDENNNIYIRKIIREQVEWPIVKNMLMIIAKQEKVPVGLLSTGVQKGFFQDLMTELELLDVPLYAINEDKDKLTRALPWIARAEAGKFYLVRGKGVDSYIDELIEFTGQGDKHDDQVDATSGGYSMLAEYIEPEVYVVGQYG
jgi:predicted phage terminase large subunit-like protein